jgi:hypothetical protein
MSTIHGLCSSDCKVDLVLIVDSSSSIAGGDQTGSGFTNWALVLDVLAKIADNFVIGPDDTRVSVVQFSDDASVVFNLTSFSSSSEVLSAIQNLQFLGGSRNTAKALSLTSQGMN